jgi:glycosyltransferase involved in cell wall biosynthesis
LNIALISTDYPPLRTSAAVQMQDLALEMSAQGYKPVMIVPSTEITEPWKVDNIKGVTVLRLRSYPFRDISYFKRTLAEFFLPFLMFYRLGRSPFSKTKWDLISWYSPTIFFGPLVWLMKKARHCSTYLILRDIFPEWLIDLGLIRKKSLAYKFFKFFANLQYKVASTIGVQTPSNLNFLTEWSQKKGKKLEVLHNWQKQCPNTGTSINFKKGPLKGRKILVYIGNMGVAQNMDVLLDLAESLKHRNDLGFLFVGRGSEVKRLKNITQQKKLKNALFFDEVASEEMPGLLAQCHLGLVALDPKHKTHNIPGKFLTYVLYGIPVLGRVNPETDLAHLINEKNVGRVSEGGDAQELKCFVEEILDSPTKYQKMSENGKTLAEKMFSAPRAAHQILSSRKDKTFN